MYKGLGITYDEIVKSTLNSYSQVFFSKSKLFAIILVIVSFFDFYAGLAGLLAIFISNGMALYLGLRRQNILAGAYGFNALLVGLGIGIYYQPSFEFYTILFFISLFTLLITVNLEGVIGKYGLPYLSIPFLIGIWAVIIASRSYTALEISERGVYTLNDMFAIGGIDMVNVYQWFNNLDISEPIRIYFKSLSAILFQYHLFAGILLALGLILYSRIAFMSSLIGFFSAYYFYLLIGANISELSYSYIGFNYILTAIAIGGYFIVPSTRSMLWVLVLTPVVAITLSSTGVLFSYLQLSVYSLPFNIVVISFLYTLKLREKNYDKIVTVLHQLNSPELHAYSNLNYRKRFSNMPVISMKLPFWGNWKVTQGWNGEITHKDDWRHAWDFEIVDENGSTYEGAGDKLSDYYCYNKPIVAPADGIIVEIESNIEDNSVGKVNLKNNWGNSIIIKHDDRHYSQLSHLKKDSVKVVIGQHVKQGEIIANLGNSGRSPYPHLHFQFQKEPKIGSPTIDYPFSSLIVKSKNSKIETVCIPRKGDVVSNLQKNQLLVDTFSFTPGTKIKFQVDGDNEEYVEWKSEIDDFNNTYLICSKTGDKAWFNSIGDVLYFTYYEGNRKSLLFYFYLAVFKLPLTFDKQIVVHDNYPLSNFPNRLLLILQDFMIPFYKILVAKYKLEYSEISSAINDNNLTLRSSAVFGLSNKAYEKYQFGIVVDSSGISKFVIESKHTNIVASREE